MDGEASCAASAPLPFGVPCDVGLACDEEARCAVCVPGAACDSGRECVRGTIDCTSGAPRCVASEEPIPGCPVDEICGTPCAPDNPCDLAVIECTMSGEMRCVRAGALPVGTGCGAGLACDARGECADCAAGGDCHVGDPCGRGEVDCTGGEPQCLWVGTLPPGTPCGAAGACDATGACSECVPGAACELGDGCAIGAVRCAAGMPRCMFERNRVAGTPCGDGGACDGVGVCEGG